MREAGCNFNPSGGGYNSIGFGSACTTDVGPPPLGSFPLFHKLCTSIKAFAFSLGIQFLTNVFHFIGQAFAIFDTREVAEMVIKRLKESCLLLSSGR